MENRPTAQQIIDKLELVPLQREGGMLKNTFYSARAFDGEKKMCGAIYYFLSGQAFSHMHQLPTEEFYHFYGGDPVELLELLPDGSAKLVVLGGDILAGQQPQYMVQANSWHGSRLVDGGEWALMGTTMAPSYTDGDYVHGDSDALVRGWPEYAKAIRRRVGEPVYR